MTHIPTALRDLADRVEQIRPIAYPWEDVSEFMSPVLQVGFAISGVSTICDWLQYHKSVEFASAFKQRFDALDVLAGSAPNPRKTWDDHDPEEAALGLTLEARIVAEYCRSLATAIESEEAEEYAEDSEGSSVEDGATPVENENNSKEPPADLKDIPPLDKTNGEWVLVPRALELTGAKTAAVLSNDRLEQPSLRSDDKCKGIDRRRRMWRKERALSQQTWYYVPSLSYKSN